MTSINKASLCVKIKFCTCEDVSKLDSGSYIWALKRLVGKKNDVMVGKVARTKEDLGGGITVQRITELLNNSECFDFDYTPSIDDTFYIYCKAGNSGSGHFNLIYSREGKWQTGDNAPFISIKQKLAEGILEVG